jgi:hypothetical protein
MEKLSLSWLSPDYYLVRYQSICLRSQLNYTGFSTRPYNSHTPALKGCALQLLETLITPGIAVAHTRQHARPFNLEPDHVIGPRHQDTIGIGYLNRHINQIPAISMDLLSIRD